MYQIGQKVFTLGDLEKNELKEKSTPTNWKKYIAFAFGGGSKPKSQDNASSKEKPALNIDKKKLSSLRLKKFRSTTSLQTAVNQFQEMMS